MAAPLSLRQPGVQPADVNAQRQRPAHAATQDGAVRGAAQGRGRGRHGHRPFMMQVCTSVIYHRHLHICCMRAMQGGDSTRGTVKRSLHSPLLPLQTAVSLATDHHGSARTSCLDRKRAGAGRDACLPGRH